MRHLWPLATGNWWTNPGRTAAAIVSVTLGVGTIVVVTSFYETTRRAITEEVVSRWLGAAHLTVHPPGAHWGGLDASLAASIAKLDDVRHVTARLRRRIRLIWPNDEDQLLESAWWWVDAIGINPVTERHFRKLPRLQGRMIQPGERGVAVIE